MTKTFLYIALLFSALCSAISCNNTSSGSRYIESEEENKSDDGYADGTWCAEVEYYNPSTGTRNTYELDVEVENNELVQIEWPNGGWLDETHFSAEDISDGECSFTSDKGYEYTVTLQSEGGCGGSDAYRMQQDIEEDKLSITCPKCGDEKDEYDDLCDNCQQKKKDAEEAAETCPICHGYKMEWDKICDNCKEEKEEKAALIEDEDEK